MLVSRHDQALSFLRNYFLTISTLVTAKGLCKIGRNKKVKVKEFDLNTIGIQRQ